MRDHLVFKRGERAMKLIRIVKLQRVPYGELDEGDRFGVIVFGKMREYTKRFDGDVRPDQDKLALDTTKYPPESETWNVEGIQFEPFVRGPQGKCAWMLHGIFDESEIETRYI